MFSDQTIIHWGQYSPQTVHLQTRDNVKISLVADPLAESTSCCSGMLLLAARHCRGWEEFQFYEYIPLLGPSFQWKLSTDLGIRKTVRFM